MDDKAKEASMLPGTTGGLNHDANRQTRELAERFHAERMQESRMNGKARVALVLPRFSRYGGVEQFAYRLAVALAERFEVHVLCGRAECEAPQGVTVRVLGRPTGFRFMKLWWFLRETDKAVAEGAFDLVVGFGASRTQDVLRVGGGPQRAFWRLSEMAWPAGWRRFAKRLRRLMDPASWITASLDDYQYTKTPLLVCVSHRVRDWVMADYPEIPEPEIIYNLPDLSKFRPPTVQERIEARERFGFALHERVICTATTNFRLKATAALILALRLLSDEQAESTVLAVAGGRAPGALRRLARKLGLKDRVRFLGKVDDMPALYHASDLFALPSWYDACSNAVLEARACGLPVLSSVFNGSSRFLPSAWVVNDPDDAVELARRFEEMFFEPPTPPLSIPDDMPAGLPAWVALIEREIARKRGEPVAPEATQDSAPETPPKVTDTGTNSGEDLEVAEVIEHIEIAEVAEKPEICNTDGISEMSKDATASESSEAADPGAAGASVKQ